MRLGRLIPIFGALALAALRSAGAADEVNPFSLGAVPDGAAVELKIETKPWQLGEELIAVFSLKNTGKEPFKYSTGGDYRGGGFPKRCRVTLTGTDGQPLLEHPDLWMADFGGGLVGSPPLAPGKTHDERVPLNRCVLIKNPGKYRVKVWHDFGWKIDPAKPHPVAEGEIELVMPSAEDARKRVEQFKNVQGSSWEREWAAAKAYSFMHYPVYIPFLKEQAIAGIKPALEGLRRIDSLEATEALLQVVERAPVDVSQSIVSELLRRTPQSDPRSAQWNHWPLSKETMAWTDAMKERARGVALRVLAEDSSNAFKLGATLLQFAGRGDDGAAVIGAMDKELARLRECRSKETDNVLDDPGAIRELTGALKALHARGFQTPIGGRIGTVLAQFCDWAEPGAQRPARFAESVTVWSDQHPILALFAVRALPDPLPDPLVPTVLKLLEHRDRAVQMEACRYVTKTKDVRFADAVVLALTAERVSWVLREAYKAACVTGKRLEAAQALADRLPDDEVCDVAFLELTELLIVTRKTRGSGGSLLRGREKRIAVRDAWRKVLADPKQQELIRKGERLDITDDQANELLGGKYFFDLPDGTQWPKKK
ncbi:MAG: hypothetical protein NTW87_19130 [Planctomycetota bacterium]|nr:hypothetical protein [Planctomycetota bacterium]